MCVSLGYATNPSFCACFEWRQTGVGIQASRQEMKWGGVCKKWTFPQCRVHYVQNQYFFILHFTYLTHPPFLRAWDNRNGSGGKLGDDWRILETDPGIQLDLQCWVFFIWQCILYYSVIIPHLLHVIVTYSCVRHLWKLNYHKTATEAT